MMDETLPLPSGEGWGEGHDRDGPAHGVTLTPTLSRGEREPFIPDLVPHAGAMVLLDQVESWSDTAIHCTAASHLLATNPLRHGPHLTTIAGLEYALQAAAVHGALRTGSKQPPGHVATIRAALFHTAHLPTQGTLHVRATLAHEEQGGMIYTVAVHAEDGTPLLDATASIALPT